MNNQVHYNRTITKDCLPKGEFKRYQKTYIPVAIKMDKPFVCLTLEGNVVSCEDGWLAVDSRGFPYPVDKVEFETTYKLADNPSG